ncbi:hypothetical protein ACWFQ8_18170 [Streptomyces sp. NPDC055254]
MAGFGMRLIDMPAPGPELDAEPGPLAAATELAGFSDSVWWRQ